MLAREANCCLALAIDGWLTQDCAHCQPGKLGNFTGALIYVPHKYGSVIEIWRADTRPTLT